jgi:hypothetical protein
MVLAIGMYVREWVLDYFVCRGGSGGAEEE